MKSKRYPEIGTVSHGTMREEDLIPDFMDVLMAYDRKTALRLAGDNQDIFDWLNDPDNTNEPEFTSEFLNETLWNALDAIAPPYCYFGATEGDGCNYGFWPAIDTLEEDARNGDGVLKVNAGDPWPVGTRRDFDYVMEVTDHGNVTLFNAKSHKEIWAIV